MSSSASIRIDGDAAFATGVRTLHLIGGGETDNSSLLTEACAEGGVWLVPEGDFLISSTVPLGDDLIIIGAGRTKTRFLAAGSGETLFQGVSTVARVQFMNCGFVGDGVYSAGKSQGLRFRGYQGVAIIDCNFYAFEVGGVLAGVPVSGGVYENILIEGCRVSGNGETYAFSGIHIFNGDGVTVRGNEVSAVARALDFEQNGDSFLQNFLIENNYVHHCRQSSHSVTNSYFGVHISTDAETAEGFTNGIIRDNLFEDNTHDADGEGGTSTLFGAEVHIIDSSDNYDGAAGLGPHAIVVHGNRSRRFTSLTSNNKIAFNVQRVHESEVTENILEEPLSTGMTAIRIRDVRDSEISDNEIFDGTVAWASDISEESGRHPTWDEETMALNTYSGNTGTVTIVDPDSSGSTVS